MLLDNSDFKDDLTLLSHQQQQMQVKTASVAAGLNRHKKETKILKYNTERTNTITLGRETIEEMESLTYLGSVTINEDLMQM